MRRDVRLLVRTRLPQHLLRQAAKEGICLTEVCSCGDGLRVCAGTTQARALQALCDRSGIPVETLSLRGGGALLAFLRARRTLLAAALAFALVSALLFGRIWRVDVAFTGSAPALGDASAILEALSGLGVRPGCPGGIDAGKLAGALSERVQGYSFLSVRRQGMRLLVTAAPEAPAPGLYDVDAPRDLYARLDGIVLSVNVRSGQACVAPGDAVRRGQLLIRGEELDRDGATRPIAALGEVVVRAWRAGTASLASYENMYSYTGNFSDSVSLSILGRDFPIAGGRHFERQSVETRRIPVGGLFLPVALCRETRREVRETRVPVDEGTLKARLSTLALADATARLGGAEGCAIVRQWLDYGNTGDGSALSARAVIEITTDAAATRETLYLGG